MTFEPAASSAGLRLVSGTEKAASSSEKSRRASKRGPREHGGFRKRTDGWLEVQTDGDWRLVCSPIRVISLSRDNNGKNWGRQLEVMDADGRRHRIALPARLISGRGDPAIDVLMDLGLRLEPGISARNALIRYLSSTHDLDGMELPRSLAANRTGWHNASFVLPARAIGGKESVVYQPSSTLVAQVREAGTLDEWSRSVASPATGNSRLVLAISLAFAAPLIGPLGLTDGFGVHVRGDSSSGKTTMLEAAGSVWGGGGLSGYRQSWHSTANGIEATAEAHCDLLLCLDELGQVRPEDAGRVAYQLSAGTGKQRALADGAGAGRREWRTLYLSTGEISLADKLREAKIPTRMMAGQAVRLIDVPADAGKGLGLFEVTHQSNDHAKITSPKERGRAFADRLVSASREHYGTAGPAFVHQFIDFRDTAIADARAVIAAVAERIAPAGADGQVQRVARHFGLIAAAGELATTFGIVPWQPGEASRAAEVCFGAWLANRGTTGAAEVNDTTAYLRGIIEQHGASRFQKWGKPDPVSDRLGFLRERDGETEYLILPESWKALMAGRDAARSAQNLAASGILVCGGDGRPTRKERLPDQKDPQRVYVVSHSRLFADDEGENS